MERNPNLFRRHGYEYDHVSQLEDREAGPAVDEVRDESVEVALGSGAGQLSWHSFI